MIGPAKPSEACWSFLWGEGPVVASAIHDGRGLRPSLARYMALSPLERGREEDYYTQELTGVASNRILVHRSRFEVDLNRVRASCVYREPADAWGLELWRAPLPALEVARSLALYTRFYQAAEHYFTGLLCRHGRLLLLDLHSFNHRRGGPEAEPDSPDENPDVDVATGFLTHDRWRPVIELLKHRLSEVEIDGRRLQVAENLKFRDGHFVAWTHSRFPVRICPVEVEFKKIYMDEWTGALDTAVHQRLHDALAALIPELLETLRQC